MAFRPPARKAPRFATQSAIACSAPARSAAAPASCGSAATKSLPLTYALSGALLLDTGGLFLAGALDALTQTLAWGAVFFVASAAASSAYLTVSELFPVELRGMAIAVFYAFGTLVGAGAPWLFGAIVDTGSPERLVAGYALAAVMMIAAAVVARWLGVDAERRSLESITAP